MSTFGFGTVRFTGVDDPGRDGARERGSVLIASLLFLVLFLFIAGFAVDLARYYMLQERTQKIADAAALAGAQALNQYRNQPDRSKAYEAVLNYIESRQGHGHAALYRTGTGDTIRHVLVDQFRDGGGDTYYKVGVLVFEEFDPFFLPRQVYGDDPRLITTEAVARLDSRSVQKLRSSPMDCGLIVSENPPAGEVGIKGNNFNLEDGALCADGNIAFEKGKDDDFPIQQWENATCTTRKGGSCPGRTTYSDDKAFPRFVYTDPDEYSVDFSQSSTWGSGSCGGGASAMETTTDTPVTWGAGGVPVCVTTTSGGGRGGGKGKGSFSGYDFTNEQKAQIQTTNGNPVTLYADDSVRFTGNGGGINGGLYSTQDIVLEKNSGQFLGDAGMLGGLSLYAERDLIIRKNNTHLEGIVGAGRDVRFTSNGGGHHRIAGIVLARRKFIDHANSNAADDITHDPDLYSNQALDLSDWARVELADQNRPDFSETNAYLVH